MIGQSEKGNVVHASRLTRVVEPANWYWDSELRITNTAGIDS